MRLEEIPIKKREHITMYQFIVFGVPKVFYLIATKEGWKYAGMFDAAENYILDIRTKEVKDVDGNVITTLVIDRTPLLIDFIPIDEMQFPEGKGSLKNVMPVPPFSETLRNYIKSLKEA